MSLRQQDKESVLKRARTRLGMYELAFFIFYFAFGVLFATDLLPPITALMWWVALILGSVRAAEWLVKCAFEDIGDGDQKGLQLTQKRLNVLELGVFISIYSAGLLTGHGEISPFSATLWMFSVVTCAAFTADWLLKEALEDSIRRQEEPGR